MKIAAVRPVLLSYDTAGDPPLEWAGGTIRSWDAALVEVTLASGATGLGEVAQGTMAAEAVPGILEALRRYLHHGDVRPENIGDHLRNKTRFWSRGGISSGVIGAVEIACLDAVAKETGQPLWQYLGGTSISSMEAYASGGLGTTAEQVAGWIREQEEAGFGTVKFRAMRDPDTTIGLLHEIIPGLLPDTQFCLDAVQGCASRPWRIEDAVRVGREVASFGGRWYEEPCAAENIEGYVTVRKAVDVDVTGVESFSIPEDFMRLIDAGGLDIAQPDVSMIGGVTQFARIANYARLRNVRCVPHIWGSGIQLMSSIHVAFALGLDLVEICTLLNPLREATLSEPLQFVGGQVQLPSTPGIGAKLPDDAEASFPYVPERGLIIR